MITKSTIQNVRQFCKPAVESGIIPADQFNELVRLARKSQDGENDTSPKETHLLTVQQVAWKLNCSTKTVHRLRNAGTLRAVYLTSSRKSLRFHSEDVETVMKGGVSYE